MTTQTTPDPKKVEPGLLEYAIILVLTAAVTLFALVFLRFLPKETQEKIKDAIRELQS